ncbi:C-GCAxxG-C-C family protein [Oxalobacter sp. OttesenSCG-928-P03]|nr:C-GCAxxG-C-C family protein [Oxalobacter sp. OttesenSCG-928-P03]
MSADMTAKSALISRQERADEAVARFREPLGEGRRISCAQAVAIAYADLAGLTEKQAMNMTAGFGGGMGKRQTCGVVTAMLMITGLSGKGEKCRGVMDTFEEKKGSTMCGELLEKYGEEYCSSLVRCAAELMNTQVFSR